MAIKYRMPLLIPSATLPSASLSKTARHIEHWASENNGISRKRRVKKINPLPFDEEPVILE